MENIDEIPDYIRLSGKQKNQVITTKNKEPTNAQFLALYSRAISEAGANSLASQLKDKKWWPKYGVATTPTDSAFFKPKNYWQGPIWVNISWLIADGLKHYGH